MDAYFRYLGYVDKIGTAFEGNTLASGFGSYIALVSTVLTISVEKIRYDHGENTRDTVGDRKIRTMSWYYIYHERNILQ